MNENKSDPFCWKPNTLFMQILRKKKILKAGFDCIVLSPRMNVLSFAGAEISKMWPRYIYDVYFYKNVMAEKKCKKMPVLESTKKQ